MVPGVSAADDVPRVTRQQRRVDLLDAPLISPPPNTSPEASLRPQASFGNHSSTSLRLQPPAAGQSIINTTNPARSSPTFASKIAAAVWLMDLLAPNCSPADVAGGSSIREDAPMTEEIVTDVCVVGGGPGGVMLGLLLARAGIHVVVLEKHVDFFRDFRGDTVHPSTLNLIDQLGIREPFERVRHTRVSTLDVVINGVRLRGIDLRSLPKPNRHIALMPQWDLLNLLAEEGRRHPGFQMLMGAEACTVPKPVQAL
jgi:hypothetical protein